jgi:hypothetical protein
LLDKSRIDEPEVRAQYKSLEVAELRRLEDRIGSAKNEDRKKIKEKLGQELDIKFLYSLLNFDKDNIPRKD